jgi:sodium-dependent dicarboxylate transporter 2/3/5
MDSDASRVFQKNAWVICAALALFFLILLLPLPQGLKPEGQRMLAVTALMAVLWMGEGIHISLTALLPLVLFPLLGIMPSEKVAPNYSNHLVFLFFGGFMIALALEKWNLHKRLALNIIVRVGHSVPRIVLGFMIATAFISLWTSNTATTMMMLPVGMAVVRQIASQALVDGKRDFNTERIIEENLGAVVMLGLAYAANIGGVGTLIGTPPNIIFAGLYKKMFPANPEITFIDWMKIGLPIVAVFLPASWYCLCRFVPSIPLGKIKFGHDDPEVIARELRVLGPMTRPEKTVAGVFLLTAGLWIFRQPLDFGAWSLPGWSGLLGSTSAYVHDATVAMTMGILLMLIPLAGRRGMEIAGRREYFLLDWETVETKVPWGTLLLFGGGFALAAGFTATELDHWLGGQLSAVAHLPLWLTVLLIGLVIAFLGELTSNSATVTMALPILGAMAMEAGIHPLYFMLSATVAASFGFMLPVATPPNSIVFGSGWVTARQMVKAGFILDVLGAVILAVAVMLLVPAVFLVE